MAAILPMEIADSTLFERRSTWWLVGILVALIFSTANVPWQLDEYSQERQALASFQMVKEGRWFYQQAPRTRHEEREATKPPLVPWISAATYAVTRSWNFAWRFPSAIAAMLLALALVRTARKTFGIEASLLALSAFAFNTLTPRLATLARTDVPLALIVFLLGAQILEKVRTNAPWTRRDRILACVLLTLAVFIKGPIVYAFILPGIIAYRWLWPNERTKNVWCGWWPWLISLGIFLVWVIGGIVTQPGFYQQVVVHEFLGRFSRAEQDPHPLYYYVAHLLQKFAPWSELLLLMSIVCFMQDRQSLRRAIQKLSPATWWLICWSLAGLIAMSFVPSKRIDRIFPVIPPLCLLVAAQFNSMRSRARWFVASLLLSILLAFSYYGYGKIYRGFRDQRDSLAKFGTEVRSAAQANHWRYQVVTAHDGALLLYLDRTQFVDAERAIAMWNAGEIDALVIETIDLPQVQPRLRGATLSNLRATEHIDDKQRSYVVLVRG
jgi:4-amino-4-deoxy-L-arabinose transferase-like glycosyltransferase